MNAGSVQGQLFKVDGCAEQEHAAVPQIPSVRQHGLGSGEIRFFHKARHSIPARGQRPTPADIPEPCFRCIRRDAECNDTPGLGAGAGPRHGFGENILRFQHMIGRQHQQQRIPPAGQRRERRQRNGGRGIPSLGLQQNSSGYAFLLQGRRHIKAVLFIADHQRIGAVRQSRRPIHRIAEQGMPSQLHELLGIQGSGKGPEAGAAAAAQDNGTQCGHEHFLSISR